MRPVFHEVLVIAIAISSPHPPFSSLPPAENRFGHGIGDWLAFTPQGLAAIFAFLEKDKNTHATGNNEEAKADYKAKKSYAKMKVNKYWYPIQGKVNQGHTSRRSRNFSAAVADCAPDSGLSQQSVEVDAMEGGLQPVSAIETKNTATRCEYHTSIADVMITQVPSVGNHHVYKSPNALATRTSEAIQGSNVHHLGRVGELEEVQLYSVPKDVWDSSNGASARIIEMLKSLEGVKAVDVQVPKVRSKRGGEL
ncbi:hypothetical protein CTheo_4434 [Ceratobasidium theobromae]|uniref:Uncharacterized protein n=1 Tax=Ceratobasidium theobromae TaxID=1582974 RepID=A0A5N5QKP8_9AGAM|nr:hypothetical protein CTheo_4434 [Ceratobasidium theobromae]